MIDMQIIKIRHIRCDQYDCTTYHLAPTDWSSDKIQEKIDVAENNYTDAINNYKITLKEAGDKGLSDPGYDPRYKSYPLDWTRGQIEDDFKKKKAAYEEWKKVKTVALKDFGYFMRQQGFTDFWEIEDIPDYDIYWGHRHGDPLSYKKELPVFKIDINEKSDQEDDF